MKSVKDVGLLGVAAISAMALFAEPQVQDVNLSQDRGTRNVTIVYRLTGEDAIVTVDVLTNGVSVGAAKMATVRGDVNRLVTASDTAVRSIIWNPTVEGFAARKLSARAVVTAWSRHNPPDYMVVDLADGSRTYHTAAEALPAGGLANDVYRTEKLVMRRIHAAGKTWRMGSPADETGHEADETAHDVTLTKDYWMGVFEFTQGQLQACARSEGPAAVCFFTNIACRATRPLEWKTAGDDVRGPGWAGADWNSQGGQVWDGSHIYRIRQATGLAFDLPTEAQWEFAARAGTGAALTDGGFVHDIYGNVHEIDHLARWIGNNGCGDEADLNSPFRELDDTKGTAKVGSYQPNAWGLYDVHGNVGEMCLDSHAAFTDAPAVDPFVTGGNTVVVRGGCWGWYRSEMQAANRLAARRIFTQDQWGGVDYRLVGFRLFLAMEEGRETGR